MSIIDFKNVSYTYAYNEYSQGDPTPPALTDISLSIEKGEFVAVLGHNGSGKSTFAKLINALLIPSAGNCFVAGLDTVDPKNIYTVRKLAGMVFQNPDNQIVASIVGEDVAFGPENLGLPSDVIQNRVESALSVVDMLDYIDKPTYALSGGQKQKTAIAGVLAMESDIIILDEPTAMLDPIGRRDVMNTVKKLNREKNITVIFITHYMDEAINASRVIVMKNGRVAVDDTPENVFFDPNKLREYDLLSPGVPDLAYRLRLLGLDLPKGILTIKAMTETLLSLDRIDLKSLAEPSLSEKPTTN